VQVQVQVQVLLSSLNSRLMRHRMKVSLVLISAAST
jgi:hypothetical protein